MPREFGSVATSRCRPTANQDGELGNGTTSDTSNPVAVSTITTATAISARVFVTCAVLSDGSAVCWGNNSQGQLGGLTGLSTTPVPVYGLTPATAPSPPPPCPSPPATPWPR